MIRKLGNSIIGLVLMVWLTVVFLPSCAQAQGTLMQLPPLTDSLGRPIAGATINVFTTTGNLPNLVCASPVTVYKDAALTLPFTTLTTDGAGNYPFFISPSANPYGLTVSGAGTATSQCYGFSAPIPPLSSPTFLGVTTGTLNVTGLATLGNVLMGGTMGVTGAASFGQSDSTGYIISAKDLTSSTLSTLHVSHFATLSGAYAIEAHGYNSCGLDCLGIGPTPGVGASNLLVLHDYSQASGTAMQIDSTGSRTILTLKNATNPITSFGTKGTSNFIDFSGFSPGSPNTSVLLMHLRNDAKFAADDSTINPGFANGMEADSATSDPRAALTVSSANTSFPGISVNETAAGIYALALTSTQNFAANFTTTTDGGITVNVEKDGTGTGTALKVINKGTGDSILVTDGTNTKLEVNSAGKLATIAGITTGNNGVPIVYPPVDLTPSAAVTTTNLNGTTLAAGQYRVTWNAKVLTPGTTSTLGAMTLGWTDPDATSLAITATAVVAAGGTATSTAGNTATTLLIGVPTTLNVKASTNITYAFGYASTGTPMTYNLHITLEKM